jgi:hypothetical protein
VERFI